MIPPDDIYETMDNYKQTGDEIIALVEEKDLPPELITRLFTSLLASFMVVHYEEPFDVLPDIAFQLGKSVIDFREKLSQEND